jgi:hypothetical protein
MPTTFSPREAGDFLHQADHRIERVGDDDDEGIRRVLLDALADRIDDLGIDADQVVAGHAGLARHAGGDDDDVRALDVLVVRRAAVPGVEALDRAELGDVERLALGGAFGGGNVEQDDVAQFLLAGEQRERAANLSGADQRDLLASHAKTPVLKAPRGSAIRPNRQGRRPGRRLLAGIEDPAFAFSEPPRGSGPATVV